MASASALRADVFGHEGSTPSSRTNLRSIMICCLLCKTGKIFKSLVALSAHKKNCKSYRLLHDLGPIPEPFNGKRGKLGWQISTKQRSDNGTKVITKLNSDPKFRENNAKLLRKIVLDTIEKEKRLCDMCINITGLPFVRGGRPEKRQMDVRLHSKKINIELDGIVHNTKTDYTVRDSYLHSLGWIVIRIDETEFLTSPDLIRNKLTKEFKILNLI